MKSVKAEVICGVVIVHLCVVSLGAAYFSGGENLPGRRVFDYYRKASGADGSFGFFAPGVGARVRGSFDLVDSHGVTRTDRALNPDESRESSLRLGSIFSEFTCESAGDPEFRQALASSLAASMFGKYPEAAQVVFRLEEYRPISMAEYRLGKRAAWQEIYRATFARNEGENPT